MTWLAEHPIVVVLLGACTAMLVWRAWAGVQVTIRGLRAAIPGVACDG